MSETEDYATTVPWTDVTGKPTEFAPEAHKASHQDAGADEIDCAGLAGRVNYVDRGDPATTDWGWIALVSAGTWTDLDCSAIVPAGAKAIILIVNASDDTVPGHIQFRKNGNTQTINVSTHTQTIANQSQFSQLLTPCDANRIIEWKLTAKTWSIVSITVAGWYI